MTTLNNLYKELENLRSLDEIEYLKQNGKQREAKLRVKIRELEDELLKDLDF